MEYRYIWTRGLLWSVLGVCSSVWKLTRAREKTNWLKKKSSSDFQYSYQVFDFYGLVPFMEMKTGFYRHTTTCEGYFLADKLACNMADWHIFALSYMCQLYVLLVTWLQDIETWVESKKVILKPNCEDIHPLKKCRAWSDAFQHNC